MQRLASAAKRQGQHPLSVKGQREAESVDAKGERKQRSHVSGVLTWDMRAPNRQVDVAFGATSSCVKP